MVSEARLRHVQRYVAETPWALLPGTLEAICEVVALRATGERLPAAEVQARIGTGPAQRPTSSVGAVAVIPVYGVIMPRAGVFTDISGGTSIDQLQQDFRAAMADPEVGAVLFDIDSPGGSASLVPEFAAEVYQARGQKPVVAVANTLAASAAYWIASQADELVVSPSAYVGSIGVYAAHDDISGAQAQRGVRTTLVGAGKHKLEGNPYEPLTDEARATMQARVDEVYDMFVAAVARGRGASPADVREGYAEGRVASARQALQLGMADRVGTFEGALGRLLHGGGGTARAVAAPGHTLAGMLEDGAVVVLAADEAAEPEDPGEAEAPGAPSTPAPEPDEGAPAPPPDDEEAVAPEGATRLLARRAVRRGYAPAGAQATEQEEEV